MKAVKVSLVASALCVALGAEALGQGRPRARHVIRRIDVTRHVLTHGRVITIRPKGILTPENPRGQRVNGITTNVPWGRRPPPNTRLTILDVIAAQRDPFRVALDLAPDGVNPRVRNRPSPLVLAGAIVPSGFTLAVADLTNPQNRAVTVYWKALVPRFGNGNFYATVPIPAAGIRRGQELYTHRACGTDR